MAARKIEKRISLVSDQVKNSANADDVWTTTQKLTYVGTLDSGITIKLELQAQDPDTLAKLIDPQPKQQFDMKLTRVAAEDTKLDEYYKPGNEEEDQS